MKLKLTIISLLMTLLLFSCRQEEEEEPQEQPVQQSQHVQSQTQAPAGANMHTAVVQEVLQATSYTYLNLKENDRDFWIAISKREIKAGETVSFAGGLEMKNFESKELQRTFESIYFVDGISGGHQSPPAGHGSPGAPHQMKPTLEKKEISIEPAEGGITIGELLANRGSYAGKTVRIKGQVTKVNRAIMGKNWVHLQDGTSDSGKFDLTITTQEQANVGEVVTFEGTIVLNKDFGAGYVYEVIIEEAKRQAE
ncbi:MAG: hypothetical protein U9Q07_03395 [Planctomycetota bacterium]|nr:hypothetical protein [Planctomycetota bacterium]